MTRDDLERLLGEGESHYLDWKRDFPSGLLGGSGHEHWLSDRGKLLKSIGALANSHGSDHAYLIYGVEDNGTKRTVHGISSSFDDATFQQWSERAFEPPPTFVYTQIEWEDNKVVGTFQIERTPDFPHVATLTLGSLVEGQVWFRRGTKNTVARQADLRRMFEGETPFKLSQSNDPVLESIAEHYRKKGRVTVLPRMEDRDSKLAGGYEVATYPNTRREVWVGHVPPDRYEHLLMLKPGSDGQS